MSSIHLRPRLSAAAAYIHGDCLADIGCDHGRLCASLLQNGAVRRAIGVDISAASLKKAVTLRNLCKLEDRWSLRVGDGLAVITAGEAEMLSFCGMGGELIASLLDAQRKIARSASRIVMQPMGGTQELRAYLYASDYEIIDERLVRDAGRLYQIIVAKPGTARPLPEGYPDGFFTFGPRMLENNDPLLISALQDYLDSHTKRLEKALEKGCDPEALRNIIEQTEAVLELAKGRAEK